MNMNSLSIVISTYNSPKYLELVLNGIINQHDQNFECIIADDGSGEETENLVKKFSKKRKFIHAWHEDKGFRLAAIRNRAIAIASGASIAFIDGDCIPAPEYS
ncbi:TPA: glycosyl transferase family 2, partial [bacterium]|nr:glycosyl transferase family 2 [bacterium]